MIITKGNFVFCNVKRLRFLITEVFLTFHTKLQHVSIKHKIRYGGISLTVMPKATDQHLIVCESLRITFIVKNPAWLHHIEQHITIVFTIPTPVHIEIILTIFRHIAIEHIRMAFLWGSYSTKQYRTCLRHLIIHGIYPALIIIFKVVQEIDVVIVKDILQTNHQISLPGIRALITVVHMGCTTNILYKAGNGFFLFVCTILIILVWQMIPVDGSTSSNILRLPLHISYGIHFPSPLIKHRNITCAFVAVNSFLQLSWITIVIQHHTCGSGYAACSGMDYRILTFPWKS